MAYFWYNYTGSALYVPVAHCTFSHVIHSRCSPEMSLSLLDANNSNERPTPSNGTKESSCATSRVQHTWHKITRAKTLRHYKKRLVAQNIPPARTEHDSTAGPCISEREAPFLRYGCQMRYICLQRSTDWPNLTWD
jgi:hypothetical protein